MLNSSFDEFTTAKTDYYPEELRDEIDSINARIYDTLNNGVYRCGICNDPKSL
jgi:Predicted glutathione S-transferase